MAKFGEKTATTPQLVLKWCVKAAGQSKGKTDFRKFGEEHVY